MDVDPDAFRRLVETHSRTLWRAAYRILGDSAAAEDAVQEAFLRAWRALPRFDDRAEMSTWLYRIVLNTAIDFRRDRDRRRSLPDALPHSTPPDPQSSAVWSDLADRAQEVITELPENERTAILLRHFEGCSIAEIAQALGAGENAAKQAVFRAVHKLRAALGPLMEVSRG